MSIQTEPIDECLIKLNTITPETLPWSGIYFKDLPISLSIPKDKVADFSHWEIRPVQTGVDTLASNIKFAPVSDVELTACLGNASASTTKESKPISIYPNPAKNKLIIDCPNFTETTIYTTTGCLMITSDTPEINLQNLQPGFYMVKVETGQESFMSKFLKQ